MRRSAAPSAALVLAATILGCTTPIASTTAASPADQLPVEAGLSPIIVSISPTLPLSELATYVDRVATASGISGGECFVGWGDLEGQRYSGRPLVLEWQGGRIEAVALCGDAIEAAMTDPRVRQVGLLDWREGRIRLGHPSDTSSTVVLEPEDGETFAAARRQRAVGLFDATPQQGDYSTAASVLTELERLATPRFLIMLMALP